MITSTKEYNKMNNQELPTTLQDQAGTTEQDKIDAEQISFDDIAIFKTQAI